MQAIDYSVDVVPGDVRDIAAKAGPVYWVSQYENGGQRFQALLLKVTLLHACIFV
jgi:hypothetical protein